MVDYTHGSHGRHGRTNEIKSICCMRSLIVVEVNNFVAVCLIIANIFRNYFCCLKISVTDVFLPEKSRTFIFHFFLTRKTSTLSKPWKVILQDTSVDWNLVSEAFGNASFSLVRPIWSVPRMEYQCKCLFFSAFPSLGRPFLAIRDRRTNEVPLYTVSVQ